MKHLPLGDGIKAIIALDPSQSEAAEFEALDAPAQRLFVVSDGTNDQGQHAAHVSTIDISSGTIVRQVVVPAPDTATLRDPLAVDELAGRAFVVSSPANGVNTMSIIDARSGIILRSVDVGTNPAALAVANRVGRVFVLDNNDGRAGTVRVFDANDGRLLRAVGVGVAAGTLTVDEISGRVYVASGASGRASAVSTLDARTGKMLRTAVTGALLGDIARDADPGPVLVDGSRGRAFVLRSGLARTGGVGVIDARSGMLLHPVTLGIDPHNLVVAPSTGHVFVMYGPSGRPASVAMLDESTGALAHTVTVGIDTGSTTVDEIRQRVLIAQHGGVSVLDARTGTILHTIRTSSQLGDIDNMVVDTPTGRLFAYGSERATASVLDIAAGRVLRIVPLADASPAVGIPLAAIDAHTERIFVIAPGQYGLGGSAKPGQVRVLNARDGEVVATVTVGTAPIKAVVDPRTGIAFILDQHDDTVTELAATLGQTKGIYTPALPISGTASPTGSPGIVRIIPIHGGSIVIDEHAGRAFVGTYKRTSGGQYTGAVNILDVHNGSVLHMINLGGTPGVLGLSTRTGHIFVPTAFAPNMTGVSMLDAHTGVIFTSTRIRGDARGLAIAAREGHVFMLTQLRPGNRQPFPPGFVSMLDAQHGNILRTVQVGQEQFSTLAVVEQTARVFVTSYGDGTVRMLDAQRGSVLRTLRVGGSPSAIAVNGTRGRVFVSNGDLVVIDARSGTIVRTVRSQNAIKGLAVALREGAVFATMPGLNNDSAVGMFDASSGVLVRTVRFGSEIPFGAPAVDERTGRVFVLLASPQDQAGVRGPGMLAVLDAVTGAILHRVNLRDTVSSAPGVIAAVFVDESDNRVFVVVDNTVVVLDATHL